MSIQSIQLADLRPPAHNPRSVIEDTALDELAASIRTDGLLQNLVVAPSRGKTYKVISGERRFAVAFGAGGSRSRFDSSCSNIKWPEGLLREHSKNLHR